MDIILGIFLLIIFINTILAIITVFSQPRDIEAIWAWLLVLTFLPVFGFIIYFLFGRKVTTEEIFDEETNKRLNRREIVRSQYQRLEDTGYLVEGNESVGQEQLVNLFFSNAAAPYQPGNEVKLLDDGEEKFDLLLEDLRQAKEYIHMIYYIFRDDGIGSEIIEVLEEKAAQGVDVRLMYDALGSRGLRSKSFKQLRANGGKVYRSFGQKTFLLNPNINYRNHRKMVIIDAEVAYTGGFNVGDDYLGKYEHMGYWRDTHIRFRGPAVNSLEAVYVKDWNASCDEEDRITVRESYFRDQEERGDVPMQIVDSGPDSRSESIKNGYMKMITMAKKRVNIQTPYLIPDEPLNEAIKIALASGVEVNIMIPNKPDHPFIYDATLYYAQELHHSGADIYIYDNGFLHSKTITVDGEIVSIGTANFDYRSFKLNFEVNSFMYSSELASAHDKIFEKDCQVSYIMDDEVISNFSWWQRFKQNFSRLLSPLL